MNNEGKWESLAILGNGVSRITKRAITVTSIVCVLRNWEKCRTFKTKPGGNSAADHKKCDYS